MERSNVVSLAHPRGTQGSDRKDEENGHDFSNKAQAAVKARHMVENNKDPLARVFGDRKFQANNLNLALIDSQQNVVQGDEGLLR